MVFETNNYMFDVYESQVNQAQCHADDVSVACLVQLFERVRYLDSGVGPIVTSQQIHALRKSWARFTKGDNDAAGLTMFMELFEQEPQIKQHFDFACGSASSQMKSSSRMIFHVSRVAWYIDHVLENLETLEEVVPMLKQVGGRHSPRGYNIPADTIELLGTALVKCLKDSDPDFTEDTEATWTEVFGWIVNTMAAGMIEYKTY